MSWISRSASVDLPWSIWAMIEKLRMFSMGTAVMRAQITLASPSGKRTLCRPKPVSSQGCGKRCGVAVYRWRQTKAALTTKFQTVPISAPPSPAIHHASS